MANPHNITTPISENVFGSAVTTQLVSTEQFLPTDVLAIVTAPTKGAVAYDATNGKLTYTPNAGETGTDQVVFTINRT